MKNSVLSLTLAFSLIATLLAAPARADHQSYGGYNKDYLGGALGAAVGGFLGSKIGSGRGQLAATAAGAVGGFVVGQHISHNRHGGKSYGHSYPQPQSYGYGGGHYPKTKSYGHGYSQPKRYDGGYSQPKHYGSPPAYADEYSPIREVFVARCTSNVRSGPSTRSAIVGKVYQHEQVYVVGKVYGRDWYVVEEGGRRGFVYAPLLSPLSYDSYGSAPRYPNI